MGNPSVVITFAIYLLFMLAIGSHFYKKNESLSDYLLGDRQLNKWVAAMSAQASDMSGWLLLGLPGYAYLQGLEAGWIAAGLAVGAKLFEAVFGLPYRSALLIGAAVIISYTALGGFMAVSWTDFFQGIIMFFAIITLPLLAIHAMGGFAASAAAMRQVSPGFMGFFTDGQGGPLAPIAVASLAAWGLGYFG